MPEQTNKNKAGLSWILQMAWRDARASKGKLMLFMASMILGIAAVVAIESFSTTLKENIALQSKSLMGADFIIDSDSPPNERVEFIMDSLGGPDAEEISFTSMIAFPKNDESKLVQVRGIQGEFPFYGELVTDPRSAASNYQKNGSALVDATVMLQLGIKPGDKIKVGEAILPIEGSLKSVAGSSAVFSSVAPPVIIPNNIIPQTNLVQTGSRIDYKYYFYAPDADMALLDEKLGWVLDAEESDIDTHNSTSQRMGRRYDNFGKFLNLVAFIALLLGCVGIASAIHIYIKEKLRDVAILKCIGATKRQTFFIYLSQIAFMGLIGGAIGTFLGYILQQSFPYLLQDLLPISLEVTFPLRVVIMGLLLGVFMSILFALYPLMGTLYISPLQALRITNDGGKKSKRAALMILAAIFFFILLFAFWLIGNIKYSLFFVIGIIVSFSILAAVAHLFMRMIKRFFPKSWGFIPRQSLLNLFRPQNQTLVLILSIGIGTFLISTLYFTKDLLLSQATLEEQANSPNMILLDVQSDQTEKVAETIQNNNLKVIQNIPIVTMRIHSIGEKSNAELKEDTTSNVRRWILNHEFRTTYRDSLIDSETLQAGTWYGELEPGKTVIPISISDNMANDASLEIGDRMKFNVQGVVMETEVASIRTVDWSRLQLNFSVVFPKNVLEDAPQFSIITTKAPDERSSANLQNDLVKNFPTVSIIDLRQVLTVIEDLLNKISWIINFIAFFSILTGIIVLIGAVRTSKYQRIRESVLLRTIGAKSGQILKILSLEYFYLGLLGALTGVLLSLGGMQLLAWQFFDATFAPSLVPFLVILPSIIALVLFIGLINSKSVLYSTPLEILRKQGV
ncbi:MAG: FtsX-like permease family protein [Flavobacteriaceae bacterium]|nr:FtsX-like permease family protein [Flavobacteriaceae bacterium]